MSEALFYDTLRQGLWVSVVISLPILAMALVAGLVIGIIAYVAYNTLVARVGKVIQNMEATTIAFMDVLDSPAK